MGDKRNLNLTFENTTEWKVYLTKVLNRELRSNNNTIQWSNCILRPGEEIKIHYKKPFKNNFYPKLTYEVSDSIALNIPKQWKVLPSAFVVGRRVWFFDAVGTIKLKVDESVLLKNINSDVGWHKDLLEMSRSEIKTFRRDRALVVRFDTEVTEAPFVTEENLSIDMQTLNIYEVDQKLTSENFIYEQGMCEISFMKGRANPTETKRVKWFDGVYFKENLSPSSQIILFKLPEGLRAAKVTECKLYYNRKTLVEGNPVQIKILHQGGDLKLKLDERGEILIDKKYVNKGVLKIKVIPDRKFSKSLKQKGWLIEHLDVAFKGTM